MSLKSKVNSLIRTIADKVGGRGVMQQENNAKGEKFVFPGMPDKLLSAGTESAVLLKNNGVLPIAPGERVSVFGRCQNDYFYVGYGSGGDVKAPYAVSLMDGLKSRGVSLNTQLASDYAAWCAANPVDHGFWGHWPMCYPEMPLTANAVKRAAKSGTALVVIGRAAGEDRENKLEKGSYYLTDSEVNMLDLVTRYFKKVAVIMDCGNIIDMSWTLKYGDAIGAVVYAWQCGMESGSALADLLTGRANFSGRLADTIAVDYKDYPASGNFGNPDYNNYAEDIFVGYRYFETFGSSRVLYPFGFGLSYTDFKISETDFSFDGDIFSFCVNVKNCGGCAGKEVVQLYVCAPCGKLKKATKSLTAFAKTRLLKPGEEQSLKLSFNIYSVSSYDEDINAYVIEEGDYKFLTGSSVHSIAFERTQHIDGRVAERLSPICPVKRSFSLITGKTAKPAPSDLRERILKNLPGEIEAGGDRGYKLNDVRSGKITLDEFVSQLSCLELEALSRGQGYMNSELGVDGNAGAFGGIIPSLMEKGVAPVITTDGPAGIRIKEYTSLIPCGTALACTWNTELVGELTALIGQELRQHGSDVLLAPGMNIHRDVLCGRNFEYFSEDPLLTGKMAAAYVRGVQSAGVSACPKHFACNNQEVKRTKNDSRLTQRALREIYLKGFEICVKESEPMCIMTSYNKINGVWSHYNYDLATTVLRGEWGYRGCVMTDWWMQKASSPEFPKIRDNAYRVRAQVDVFMPGDFRRNARRYKSDGSLLKTLGKKDGITIGELQRTAENVLNLILKLGKEV